MHEYNHFISGNRLLRWYFVQYNHHAALVHTLRGRKKPEKGRKIDRKNTASSSKQYYFEYLVKFFKEPTDKKKKDRGTKSWEATSIVPGIRITSRTLWTTTIKLEAGPAAKGHDNEGQMRRSHVCFFGLVATCDVPGICPTQKLPLFFNFIHMGPRKNKHNFLHSYEYASWVLVRTTCHLCAEIASDP